MSDEDLVEIIAIATRLLEHRKRMREISAEPQQMPQSEYASMMSVLGLYDYDCVRAIKRKVVGL